MRHVIPRTVAAPLVALLTVLAALLPAPGPAGAAPPFHSAAGITVLGVADFGRVVNVRISTPAVSTAALSTRDFHDVSIILPAGYDPGLDYPVLYLHHGRGGGNGDWIINTDVEELTAERKLIVVMPQGGRAGWGANWRNQAFGAQQWDTFHLDQLIGWVDANLSTIPNRTGRAVAGFSMGATTAIRHAAMRPQLFSFAAGFSGGYDLEDARMRGVVTGSLFLEQLPPDGPFGAPWDPAWADNNPWRRPEAFRDIHTVLYAGTNWSDPAAGTLERESHAMSFQFWQRLQAAGATRSWFLEYADPTCGHHYGCAREALARELGPMMDVLAGP
ncbi:MAG TPA: alpha/beta hydrolase-fold protein [Iamia sp.]|jgi:S-formylglutathione hydrolase FrmB|nr:alpha/beta hydrolase-fold protein [Iamia sp.]